MTGNNIHEKPIYDDGLYQVTHSFVRTPRINVSLSDVDLYELRQPLLWMVALAVFLTWVLALRFFSLIYWSEIFWLIVTSAALIYGAAQVGILKLNSLSMNNEKIIAPIKKLHKIRAAIEVAMNERDGKSSRPRVDV